MTTTQTPAVIDRFQGEWRFLSNFVPCPWIEYDGLIYPSVENAFQAAKSYDPSHRSLMRFVTAASAKRTGRTVKLRDDWQDMREPLMRDFVWQKFAPGHVPDFHLGLRRTGDAVLIEGNDWGDNFWGAVPRRDGALLGADGRRWQGSNILGKILMDVRAGRRVLQEAIHG